MRILLTQVFVDDQQSALDFYTGILGFQKKNDSPLGEARWLTVVSPEAPDETELLLETQLNPQQHLILLLEGNAGNGGLPRVKAPAEVGPKRMIFEGIQQDLDIWKHKVHRANPVFCEGDHYLGDFRKWARQFYTHPVGDVRKPESK